MLSDICFLNSFWGIIDIPKIDKYWCNVTDKSSGEITGKVVQIKSNEYGYKYVLDSKILVSFKENPGIQKGDYIRAAGEVAQFSEVRNDGEFNLKMYYKSIGIFYNMKAERLEIVKKANLYDRFINNIYKSLDTHLKSVTDSKDYGTLKAILLGDKTSLDDDMYKLYQKNGIAHLLAISGLHVSFIGMALYELLRKKNLSILSSFVITLLVLGIYSSLTGDGFSARRAVIMCTIKIGAQILGRSYDALTALAVSSIALICENPYVIYHSGFQLSFMAIVGIYLMSPIVICVICSIFKILEKLNVFSIFNRINIFNRLKIYNDKNIDESQLIKSFSVSLSITLFTMPVIAYNYFEIPISAILLNVIVIPLMSVLLLSGILAIMLSYINIFIAEFFIGSVHYILQFYTFLCGVNEHIFIGKLLIGRPDILNIVIYYILILIIILAFNFKKKKINCIFFITVIILSIINLGYKNTDGIRVNMLDVGQGDGIVVECEGKTIIFDGGSSNISNVGEKRIYPFLRSRKVKKIDYIFVSHSDKDHINGIKELIDMSGAEFKICNIVMPLISDEKKDDGYLQLVNSALQKNINVEYMNYNCGKNNVIKLGSNVEISCINPNINDVYDDVNAYSAVYLVKYYNFKMLMTGDVTLEAEKNMLENLASYNQLGNLSEITVLKVAHHGSKGSTSKEFLDNTNPLISIISCGINNKYGHPNIETIERLQNKDTAILQTNINGQITIKSDGKTVEYNTKIKKTNYN